MPEDKEKDDSRQQGGLEVTRRGLYAREESEEFKERAESLRRLGVERREDETVHKEDTLSGAAFKNLRAMRAKRFAKLVRFGGLLFVLLIVLVVGVAVTLWYRSQFEVSEDQIRLEAEAPLEVTAGDEITYIVRYENTSRVDWLDVEVVFTPPRGFSYRSGSVSLNEQGQELVARIGRVDSGQGGSFEIRGQLIGELNQSVVAQSVIFLTPENFPSGRFDKSEVTAINIAAVPVEVALDIPTSAGRGERVVGRLTVRNLSSSSLEGVYVKLEPPIEMELDPADEVFTPGFSQNQREWQIGMLDSLASRELAFVFSVSGEAGEKRVLDIEAGIRQPDGDSFVQRRLSHSISVAAREVEVRQTVNGSSDPIVVKPGDTVKGQVFYRNAGTIGLGEAIVEVSFEGVGFDPDSLDIESGAYNPRTQSIVWSAATEPNLSVIQPQEEGILEYSFDVLDTERFPVEGDGSSNNVIVTTATVDSPDIPLPPGEPRRVVSDRSVMSVGTMLRLSADSFYDDGRLGITSQGPLPPRVGDETTYTVRFRIGTTLNTVADVRLAAVLPDGVRYTGQHYKTGGEITFNDRTGRLGWSLPQMVSSTGRNLPPQELHIQVAIVPGENQRGGEVPFLNELRLDAVDQFTEQREEVVVEAFPTTETAEPGQGIVQ